MVIITATCIVFLYFKKDIRLLLASLISLTFTIVLEGFLHA